MATTRSQTSRATFASTITTALIELLMAPHLLRYIGTQHDGELFTPVNSPPHPPLLLLLPDLFTGGGTQIPVQTLGSTRAPAIAGRSGAVRGCKDNEDTPMSS